jgi:hypothetical protein
VPVAERTVVLEYPEAVEPLEMEGRVEEGERSSWDEFVDEFEIGWLSPMLRRFFVSGPFSQFSEVFMLARVSSAVYILRAMVFKARRILSVCQVDGPSYRGTGAGKGPSS